MTTIVKTEFDVLFANNALKAEGFLDEIRAEKPLFILTIATTETGKIAGISAAGKYPEFTDYTPPADAELLLLGKCKCINGVPVTPEGIPTPALITMSALHLADLPVLICSGGLRVKPQIPFWIWAETLAEISELETQLIAFQKLLREPQSLENSWPRLRITW